jgi:hypothetical protein
MILLGKVFTKLPQFLHNLCNRCFRFLPILGYPITTNTEIIICIGRCKMLLVNLFCQICVIVVYTKFDRHYHIFHNSLILDLNWVTIVQTQQKLSNRQN